jgi:heme/copper-type cytochrome/quinol oxidase subunit 3
MSDQTRIAPAASGEDTPLTRDEIIALKNKRTAVTVFQISWIMVFVCLIVINLQIRSNFTSWPPPDVPGLEPILPTLATLGLLASAVLAGRGVRAIARDERARFFQPWGIALGLGTAFVLIMAFEWVIVQDAGQFGTIFRVMVAYHAIHAIVIGCIMWRVYQSARRGAYSPRDYFAVEGTARLWYFVVVAWILFYVVLYIL